MKKILTVLLIAVMAAGFVFASVDGYARIDFGYNTANKAFGFKIAPKVNFDVCLGETAATDNKGDVYAVASAQGTLEFADVTQEEWLEGSGVGVDFYGSVSAKIVGKNWSVGIKTAKFNPVDYAVSAIDTFRDAVYDAFDNPKDYAKAALSLDNGYYKQAGRQGVEVKAFDYTFGVAANGLKEKTPATASDYAFYAYTPEIKAGDASFQFGVVDYLAAADKENTFDVSAKIGYAADVVEAGLAADVVVETVDEASEANFDIAANFKYDFVKLDAYYVSALKKDQYMENGALDVEKEINIEKYASAKLGFDFAKFDVPVTFTFTVTDILNKNSDTDFKQSFKGEVTYKGIVDASASYKYTKEGKASQVKASLAYNFGLVKATAAAELKFASGEITKFMPQLYLESDKLVSGAKLSLGWYENTDKRGNGTSQINGNAADKGIIRARCQINF